MPKRIDCDHTHELICPYCGHEQSDPNEYFGLSSECAEIECGDCGLEFSVSRYIDITYTSEPMVQEVKENANA